MHYELACGHRTGRVDTDDKHKRAVGQEWDCFWCGRQGIVKVEGRTA